MFKNYLTTSIRNLLRNKVYSLINILGLSLGLASAMLIVLYVKDEVSFDRFHTEAAHIYRVGIQLVSPQGVKGHKDGNTGYLEGPGFKDHVPEIKSFVRLQDSYADIKKGTDVHSQELLLVDSNFLSVFTFPLLSGNPRTCLAHPDAVVISEEMAKSQFGNQDALGKIIMLKEDTVFQPYTVTAVTRKCPQNSTIKFDMLLPMKVPPRQVTDKENWFNFFLNTFVEIEPRASAEVVENKVNAFFARDSRDAYKSISEKYGPQDNMIFLLEPLVDLHLNTEMRADNGLSDASNPMFSYILSGIALFVLLIACINFVNLTVARSVKRAKEIGIRKVVGGERRQLIIQFLGESFLLCLIAFLLAILLVQLFIPLFNQLANKSLALSYLFDWKLIASYIGLFGVTGLLAGFYPALVLSAYSPVQTLYSRFQLAGKNYLQKSLVVLQFALASFLIIATVIISSQLNYLTTEKLGYDDTNLLSVTKNSLKRNEASLFRQELLKNPNILGVAFRNGGEWSTTAKINGDSTINFDYETINETFLPTLKIPIVAGRNFSREFPSDPVSAVLVNERFVQQAGWKDPIGQEVNFWYDSNRKYRVIGVVKDYHFESLSLKIGPQLFTMRAGDPYGTAFIKIKPNSETSSLPFIQKLFKNLFPLSPYNYVFKDQENARNYEAEAKWKQIMLFGALFTIFISCIGLFGLSVLSAEKRTKEIGIRRVLGASVRQVVTILTRDFLALVVIALAVAVPVAFMLAGKWLLNYPYHISLSWIMFALAAFVVITIALVTVSFQAFRAAVASPVKSLRTE